MTLDRADLKKSILVVDDEYTIRETLKLVLLAEGYDVNTASNGQEALDEIRFKIKPNLILLDMMMPIMNGQKFLQELLADPKISKIPVVVVSAIANDQNAAGARGFMKKPPDIKKLIMLIEKHIS